MASLRRAALGVEIGSREIRMVEMRGGNPPQVVRIGSVPLPPNAVDGDRIVQVEAVADLLRGLHSRLGCQSRSVVIGMGLQSVVTRVLDIPRVPDSELRVVLEGELAHYQILRAGAGAFDFFRLTNPSANNETLPSVLLMATEERVSQGFRVVVEKAGLQFVALEPITLALFRAAFPLLENEPATLCLAVTPSRSELSILDHGQIRYYRRLDQGSDDFIKGRRRASARIPGSADLSLDLGVPVPPRPPRLSLNQEEDDTDELQTGGLFNRPGTGNLPPQFAGTGNFPQEDSGGGGKVTPQAAASLANEVQRSLEYYQREFPTATQISRIVLSANDPEAAEVASWLSQSLQMDVRVVEPPLDAGAPSATAAALQAPQGLQFLGAIGLALHAVMPDSKVIPRFNLATTSAASTVPTIERDRLTAVMIGAICILIGGFFSGLMIGRSANGENEELDRLKKQYTLNQNDYNTLDKRIADEQALDWIVKSDNLPMPAIIDQVTRDLPLGIGLKNFQVDRNGKITVEGNARDLQEFNLYYLNLRTCPHFVGTRAQSVSADPLTHITTFRIETALGGTQAALQSDSKPF